MNYILDTVFKIAQLDVFHLFTKAKLVETFQCMYYFLFLITLDIWTYVFFGLTTFLCLSDLPMTTPRLFMIILIIKLLHN